MPRHLFGRQAFFVERLLLVEAISISVRCVVALRKAWPSGAESRQPHPIRRERGRHAKVPVRELPEDLRLRRASDDGTTRDFTATEATLIYRRTKNLRALQLLLGHSKLESTVRYLGIEVDDALEISEQTEI